MEQKQNLSIPIAIVLAGALIGGALFFIGRTDAPTTNTNTNTPSVTQKDIPGVTSADHIIGSIDAPIIIVEYTDLECPFCKQFDGTMKQVVKAYGGKVAWVVRNFPLQQLHPNAPKIALGAECAAALGGNETYFKFLDSVFTQAPINTFFDITKLTATAEGVGVDAKKFNACVIAGTYQDKISKEFNDAVAAGGQGTPFSVAITKNGKQYPIPGSQPLEQLKTIIDGILAGK